jgi:hypothetical protein
VDRRLVDRPSPEQIARYRAMTPAERLRQAGRLYWSARRLREAYERSLHPDWTDDQIRAHVRRVFLLASLRNTRVCPTLVAWLSTV